MRSIFPFVGVAVLVGSLSACGQQGPLFLPTEPAAANRATLTETLRPGIRRPANAAASAPDALAPAASATASTASSPSAPQ